MSSSKDVLREELVLLEYEARSAEDVLQALVDILHNDGAVKETYFDAMLAREKEFPTGLPTEGIKVALPHAGVEHVNYSALAVATLKHPVEFGEMGGLPESRLNVEIVLMLANADPEEQVQTLRKLVDMFDEPGALLALKSAKNPAEAVHLIREGYQRE